MIGVRCDTLGYDNKLLSTADSRFGEVTLLSACSTVVAKASSIQIDESTLTKGQLRKLNALRKSVGDEIGAQVLFGVQY